MTIPTDDEMEEFQDSLEALGPDEVERKLNQWAYGNATHWKNKEANRFIKLKRNESTDNFHKKLIDQSQEANKISKESNQIALHSNKIAWWALGVSIIAVIIALLAFILNYKDMLKIIVNLFKA